MKISVWILSLLSINVLANECTIDEHFISANYEITANENENTRLKNANKDANKDAMLFEFHRQGNKVLQYFPKKGVSQVWSMNNDRISLIRAFDEYRHAIEYQPSELKQNTWHRIYQPLPVPNFTQWKMTSEQGTGCLLEQHYTGNELGAAYHIIWLPHLALVKRLEVKSARGSKEWMLSHFESNSLHATHLFSMINEYASTDYADIGDNESIPFLARMINQGFSPMDNKSKTVHHHSH